MALQEIKLWGTHDKPKEAIKMLQFYEILALERDERGYCVGYSGGKDSTVLAQIFKESEVKHFFIHSITGLDAPELIRFKNKMFKEWRGQGIICNDIIYEKNIIQLMCEKRVPPTRIMRYCCAELKERNSPENENAIKSFGVRKLESAKRAKNRNQLEACKGKKTKYLLLTIAKIERILKSATQMGNR